MFRLWQGIVWLYREARRLIDVWDVQIYGGVAIVYVSLLPWSSVVAGTVAGLILLALGVFGPRLSEPKGEK